MMRFTDRVFAITGAARGIGRRVAERAALEGAQVAVIDRLPIGADVADAITSAGGQANHLAADLETYSSAEAAMAAARAAFGRIDVPVNNVGGTIWANPFEHHDAPRQTPNCAGRCFRRCMAVMRCRRICCLWPRA